MGSARCGILNFCPQSFKFHLPNSRLLGHPEFVFTSQLGFEGLEGDLQVLCGEICPLHRNF
ncbi:hypothetical protein ACTFBT_20705 [Streptomyces microflavus]|uniref:hypothetical protein n=1 Tax=Streptomyces TaxID=1883 RepID=UPI0005170261|nr:MULTISPECIES: hypothetical protein [Streptomyces]MDX2979308.1 hypothetical protein [Streptomyces sp. NRRL_B-2249]